MHSSNSFWLLWYWWKNAKLNNSKASFPSNAINMIESTNKEKFKIPCKHFSKVTYFWSTSLIFAINASFYFITLLTKIKNGWEADSDSTSGVFNVEGKWVTKVGKQYRNVEITFCTVVIFLDWTIKFLFNFEKIKTQLSLF